MVEYVEHLSQIKMRKEKKKEETERERTERLNRRLILYQNLCGKITAVKIWMKAGTG